MIKAKEKKDAKKTEKPQAPVVHNFVVEFRKYTTELNRKYLNRKPWVPPDESKVLSFIPGTISKIYVKEGQQVVVGQELLILEAMKMKNTLYAANSGKILNILVREGEKVPKSKVIIELDLD